jgi:KaiC/GvpD/RAD55 family RecA-like ATPase
MVKYYKSSISGFDELTGKKKLGFPEKSIILVYGPPKTGKTILCYQIMYNLLEKNGAGLYITADSGLKELEKRINDFGWDIEPHMKNKNLYVIDLVSNLVTSQPYEKTNYKCASIQKPADMIVKVGTGIRYVDDKSEGYISIFDSLTTSFAFNPDYQVLKFLKSYIERIKESKGISFIIHTKGTVDEKIEDYLIESADYTIIMDGKNISIDNLNSYKASYTIENQGINIF